jgi:hypothetical protein
MLTQQWTRQWTKRQRVAEVRQKIVTRADLDEMGYATQTVYILNKREPVNLRSVVKKSEGVRGSG